MITEGIKDSGIARLEVKFRYFRKTNGGVSGRVHCVFIDQERESGDRRWLDTVLVLTVNDTNSSLYVTVFQKLIQNPRETVKSLGSGGNGPQLCSKGAGAKVRAREEKNPDRRLRSRNPVW